MIKTKNKEYLGVLVQLQEVENKLEKLSVDIKDYWQTETEIKKLKEEVAKIYKNIAILKIS